MSPEGSNELGSILPSFCPSILLSGSFLAIDSLVFSETQHGVEAHVLLCMKVAFVEKNFMPQKQGKWAESGPKIGFFGFIEKVSH